MATKEKSEPVTKSTQIYLGFKYVTGSGYEPVNVQFDESGDACLEQAGTTIYIDGEGLDQFIEALREARG